MSILSALGARPISTSLPPAAAQNGSAAAGAQAASASGKTAAPLAVVDSVATPDNVTISRQGLASRADQNGNRTLDVAQQFLSAVAKKLFGEAADGATVSYNAASLSTSETAAASVSHSEDASGVTDTASLGLSESAHFTGKGLITTADGHTVEFEIDVQYEANIYASSSTRSGAAASSSAPAAANAPATAAGSGAAQQSISAPDALALTGTQLPAIKFPGSLADLFDLLGRALQQPGPSNPSRADNGVDGNLTLRLQRLVNSAALLAPRAPSGTPARALQDSLAAAQGTASAETTAKAAASTADTREAGAADQGAATTPAASAASNRSRALANSYGTPPPSSELATA
jgi:hypothetical protein